jgi:hypothetical protein
VDSLNASCPYNKNWPEDGSLEPKHVANYVLIDYICVVFDRINYFVISIYKFCGLRHRVCPDTDFLVVTKCSLTAE